MSLLTTEIDFQIDDADLQVVQYFKNLQDQSPSPLIVPAWQAPFSELCYDKLLNRIDNIGNNGTIMKHLSRVWHGTLSLEKVFWEWAVFGGIAINVASSIGFLILALNNYLIAAVIVGYGLSLPYNLLVTVGVFRSADRYTGEKRWADLAKLTTMIVMVLLSVT